MDTSLGHSLVNSPLGATRYTAGGGGAGEGSRGVAANCREMAQEQRVGELPVGRHQVHCGGAEGTNRLRRRLAT